LIYFLFKKGIIGEIGIKGDAGYQGMLGSIGKIPFYFLS
jgi:hypothetical protein